jgi:hypothetical protein
MFTLHDGGSRTRGSNLADVQTHELHQEPAGPLDGVLLDLYSAVLIIVPLAILMKAFLF